MWRERPLGITIQMIFLAVVKVGSVTDPMRALFLHLYAYYTKTGHALQ